MRKPTVRLWFADGSHYDGYFNMWFTHERKGEKRCNSTLFLKPGDLVSLPSDAQPAEPSERVLERLENLP
jgi:hypothetical protein